MARLGMTPRDRGRMPPDTTEASYSSRQSAAVVRRDAADLTDFVLEEVADLVKYMHQQSIEGKSGRGLVDFALLKDTTHWKTNRAAAIDFFNATFSRMHLRDDWLVSVLSLLDRHAIERKLKQSESRAMCKPRQKDDIWAEWLAAALVVLKQAECEAETDSNLRDVISRIWACKHVNEKHDFPRVWNLIVLEEFRMYRLLRYRVAVPTSLEIAVRIGLEVCAQAQKSMNSNSSTGSGNALNWLGLAEGQLPAPYSYKDKTKRLATELAQVAPRYILLASYLVELGVAHAAEIIYLNSAPPLALALACLELALHAFPGPLPPPQCAALLTRIQREATSDTPQQAAEIQRALPMINRRIHALWSHPPVNSPVAKKWGERTREIGGPLPTASSLPDDRPATWGAETCESVFCTPNRRVSPARSRSRTKRRMVSEHAAERELAGFAMASPAPSPVSITTSQTTGTQVAAPLPIKHYFKVTDPKGLAIGIRAGPDIEARQTNKLIRLGEVFPVAEITEGSEGEQRYLQLSDARGWLFTHSRHDGRLLCTEISEDEFLKAMEKQNKPEAIVEIASESSQEEAQPESSEDIVFNDKENHCWQSNVRSAPEQTHRPCKAARVNTASVSSSTILPLKEEIHEMVSANLGRTGGPVTTKTNGVDQVATNVVKARKSCRQCKQRICKCSKVDYRRGKPPVEASDVSIEAAEAFLSVPKVTKRLRCKSKSSLFGICEPK